MIIVEHEVKLLRYFVGNWTLHLLMESGFVYNSESGSRNCRSGWPREARRVTACTSYWRFLLHRHVSFGSVLGSGIWYLVSGSSREREA